METKFKGIDENTVVWCSTEQQAQKVVAIMDRDRGSGKTLWEIFKDQTCYDIIKDQGMSLRTALLKGYDVIPANIFLAINKEVEKTSVAYQIIKSKMIEMIKEDLEKLSSSMLPFVLMEDREHLLDKATRIFGRNPFVSPKEHQAKIEAALIEKGFNKSDDHLLALPNPYKHIHIDLQPMGMFGPKLQLSEDYKKRLQHIVIHQTAGKEFSDGHLKNMVLGHHHTIENIPYEPQFNEALPEKWFIRFTAENCKELFEWWKKNCKNSHQWKHEIATHLNGMENNKKWSTCAVISKHPSDESMFHYHITSVSDYQEITIKQLKRALFPKNWRLEKKSLSKESRAMVGKWYLDHSLEDHKFHRFENESFIFYKTEGDAVISSLSFEGITIDQFKEYYGLEEEKIEEIKHVTRGHLKEVFDSTDSISTKAFIAESLANSDPFSCFIVIGYELRKAVQEWNASQRV